MTSSYKNGGEKAVGYARLWIFMEYEMVCFLVTPTNGRLPKYLLLLQREGVLFVEETKMNL